VRSPDRFFLFGYFGQGNLGDDLLLRATVEGIRRLLPAAQFVVRNEGEIAGVATMGAPVELTYIDRILADRRRSRVGRLIETLSAYSAHFRRCQWLVFSGGTLFHERTSIQSLILTFLICLVARLRGARIAALGVGVADLRSGAARLLLRAVVSLADVFAVRDEAALAQCRAAGVENRVHLTGDLVFGLASLYPSRSVDAIGKPGQTVGLSLYPPVLSDTRLFSAVQQLVTALISRGWRIVLMSFQGPMEERTNGISDRSLFAGLKVNLSQQQRTMVSERILTATLTELSAAYSGIDVHCGLRFHGHVLAAIFGKPFVGISHDNKIDEICRSFNMPCVDVRELSSREFVAKINEAASRVPDPAILNLCIAASARNFSLLSQALSGPSGNRR
jgi:polysaccharide pyruvyl transferase WcaK-like protein